MAGCRLAGTGSWRWCRQLGDSLLTLRQLGMVQTPGTGAGVEMVGDNAGVEDH